jgi:hypothetical protein
MPHAPTPAGIANECKYLRMTLSRSCGIEAQSVFSGNAFDHMAGGTNEEFMP